MRVCMTAGQDVFMAGERIEKITVEQVIQRRRLEFVPASELISSEEVLRHDVGLIIRRILLPYAIVAALRHQRS